MKTILIILILGSIIVLGIYYPVVWWIIGITIIVVIALIYFVLSSFDKGHDSFMKNKFGENYKQLMADGKLGLCTACSCQPDLVAMEKLITAMQKVAIADVARFMTQRLDATRLVIADKLHTES